MDFRSCFLKQIEGHPSMMPQDAVKLCYQAAYGGEHILSDKDAAERYFNTEFDALTAAEGVLFEPISEDICRVNMAAWKNKGLPGEWLFRLFCLSAEQKSTAAGDFEAYLKEAEECLDRPAFSKEAWFSYLSLYRKSGGGPVHHSEAYRAKEAPAYRLVCTELMRMVPLFEKLQAALRKTKHGSLIVAIDGPAGSGKSTLAENLAYILSEASSVYMDDFFLPPILRTRERLGEPGGNLHYERFGEEVLPFLSERKPFSYRIFDCSCMDYNGLRMVDAAPVRIVEGSYSHHPRFGDYADLRVFVNIAPQEQMRRILARNGEQMAELFKARWIPMEEAYFNAFQIRQKADLIME